MTSGLSSMGRKVVGKRQRAGALQDAGANKVDASTESVFAFVDRHWELV